mgnify:CR=1 FL=1
MKPYDEFAKDDIVSFNIRSSKYPDSLPTAYNLTKRKWSQQHIEIVI